MKAIILINLESGDTKGAYRDLRKIDGITNVFLTFGPYDAIALVETDDLNRIGRIVEFEIQTIPEVAKTLTCLLIEGKLPLPDLEILNEAAKESLLVE